MPKQAEKEEAVWNILNNFRARYFFSELTAEIKIEDFDKMMDEVKNVLNSQ